MGLKLFNVEIGTTIVVVAEDEREAAHIARSVQHELDYEPDTPQRHDWLPDGWEGDCRPYALRGTLQRHGDLTIHQWAELLATDGSEA